MSFRIFFLVFILLAGCATQPTLLPPTITTLSASTMLPSLTDTLQPLATETASATLKPTRTISATITKTLSPTIDSTTTAIVADLITTVQPRRTIIQSPNGLWNAQLLTYDCTKVLPGEWYESAYDLLQIIHLPDHQISFIADQLQYCGGVGAAGLGDITWSPNSRYFYFTTSAYGVPDGSQLGWQRTISRYDTTTAQIEIVGGPFSPDKQKIAGVHLQNGDWCLPQTLVVQTLNGDILVSYPISSFPQTCQYGWRSNMNWASNSQELAYLENPCDPSGCKSTLYRIDLKKNERSILFTDHQPAFLEVNWSQPDRLTLIDQDFKTWFYIFSNGRLEQQ